MIQLTNFNSKLLEIDADLIEHGDATPETVLTMVDGTRHMVKEDLAEVIDLARRYKAGLIATGRVVQTTAARPIGALVSLPRKNGRQKRW